MIWHIRAALMAVYVGLMLMLVLRVNHPALVTIALLATLAIGFIGGFFYVCWSITKDAKQSGYRGMSWYSAKK